VFVTTELADVEANLASGATDLIQLGAVVGIFRLAMDMTASGL
jgi:hypothetical protein